MAEAFERERDDELKEAAGNQRPDEGATVHQQPPPGKEASGKAQEGGSEETQAARRASNPQPPQQVAEAAAREALRVALKDLEETIIVEAEEKASLGEAGQMLQGWVARARHGIPRQEGHH